MKKTNFLFILADDLGYADLGCYGGRAPVSPNLDALARRGLLFRNGYANSPVCSPTRFGLITGRYQYRLRGAAEEPLTGRFRGSTEVGLPPEHPTLPSLLRDAGYHTALIGKWHLGYPPHFGPQRSGYIEHFGPLSGGVDYWRHVDRKGHHDLVENGREVFSDQYMTDLLSDRAVDFVRQRGADHKPFLLSLHYTAPHWPWQTRHERTRPEGSDIVDLQGGSIRVYQEMIREMDEGIGRIVAELAHTGQLEDTLIVFTSDNGGERFSDNWPLVGGKMDLTEGGIRVPYVVCWPRVIAPGGVTDQHTITMDWTATFLDIAGVAPGAAHPLDGISLLPQLRAPAQTTARRLFWRMKHRAQRALRDGRWKYLAIDADEYLFDVETDERERANLAQRHPDRLVAMREQFDAWNRTMPAIAPEAVAEVVYTLRDMPAR